MDIHIGKLKIGKKYPIRIKGMLKNSLKDKSLLLEEAKKLKEEGAEAIRVAIKYPTDAKIVSFLKQKIDIPFVADIHFNYKLAIESIEAGFDGIRLNPLNIKDESKIKEVVKKAKQKDIHIRVGINSGGFRKKISQKTLAEEMVKTALDYVKILEKENFYNISVSLKASSVFTTILANRLFSSKSKYPLHLGITATGSYLEGIVKSTLGIGILLNEGIGNIIRVSLTAPSFLEVRVAKIILQSLNLRYFEPEIISCPTCSRCTVNLIKFVDEFREKISKANNKEKLPKRIAIMGCEVNGPGEATQADIGIAFGNNRAVIFKKNKILHSGPIDSLIEKFFEELGVENGCKGN